MKWQNKLTKKELKHLKESGITTKYQLSKQLEYTKELMKEEPYKSMVCWDCIHILKKLGMWED